MTLSELKKRVLSLIEEINPESELLTDDEDIKTKINYCIDLKQTELSRIKKIPAIETIKGTKDKQVDLNEELDNFYKLDNVSGCDIDIFGNYIIFNEDGEVMCKYYKYPKKITSDTKETYKFELDPDVLDILPYGVAADLLKSDISAQYGRVYDNEYQRLLQSLDIRNHSAIYTIQGGINV